MEFRRIEYFLVLADKLNYAKAAAELCISAQALTKQINILEDELGTKLFHRTTRSVELTEDGVMCKNQFSNLKAVYDETIAAVEDAIRRKTKTICIGFFAPLPRNEFLAPLIHTLSAQFPDIEFEITTNSMDGLREQLKSGEIDLALTNAHDFEDWIGCDLIVFKTAPAQIVVSPKHAWVKEGKQTISLEDMEKADIVLLTKHGPYEYNSFYARVKTKSRSLVSSFDTLIMELEKGKKFAVFPMLYNDMDRSNFVCFDLPEEYRFHYRTMCACKLSSATKEVKKVFRFIKEHQKFLNF